MTLGTNGAKASPTIARGWQLRLFSPLLRWSFFVLTVATIVAQVVPLPPIMPPPVFYFYKTVKVFCFFLIGYLTPLSFWRFNTMNGGVLFAVASTALIESLQRFLSHGHSFSWLELLIKMALMFAGFALALGSCYEGKIAIGPIRIALLSEHLPGPE